MMQLSWPFFFQNVELLLLINGAIVFSRVDIYLQRRPGWLYHGIQLVGCFVMPSSKCLSKRENKISKPR